MKKIFVFVLMLAMVAFVSIANAKTFRTLSVFLSFDLEESRIEAFKGEGCEAEIPGPLPDEYLERLEVWRTVVLPGPDGLPIINVLYMDPQYQYSIEGEEITPYIEIFRVVTIGGKFIPVLSAITFVGGGKIQFYERPDHMVNKFLVVGPGVDPDIGKPVVKKLRGEVEL